VSACTGLPGSQIAQSAAIRIGQARGYRLEEIDPLPPETIARAGEGDAAALKAYEERRLSRVGRGSPDQRPSMGQDMAKGRRTEIEYLNDFVVRDGEQIGIQARANERLVDIVKRVARGELEQDPRHITELRLNDARFPNSLSLSAPGGGEGLLSSVAIYMHTPALSRGGEPWP